MIYLEAWFKDAASLDREQQLLLEMLERDQISPEEFATRWKRMKSGPKGQWLEIEPDGFHVRMTTEWLQSHRDELKELYAHVQDLAGTSHLLLDEPADRMEVEEALTAARSFQDFISPVGKIVGLKGVEVEPFLNDRLKGILERLRTWAPKVYAVRLEHERRVEGLLTLRRS